MIRILVAMEREAASLGVPCTVIGIKGTAMPKTSEEDILVNVGYCGAIGFRVGTIVEPNEMASYETAYGQKLQTHFDCFHAPCFTAEKFVVEPCSVFPSVYDMELLKIAALPHKELYALKIVSDNLDEAKCERFNDKKQWMHVRALLKWKGLI